jgi:ABC-type polysaccharide/polyol phosphate export permease
MIGQARGDDVEPGGELGTDADTNGATAIPDATERAEREVVSFPRREVPDAPSSDLRYHRALELRRSATSLWRARLTVWALIIRQVRSQYSQQFLGVAWAILGPFAQTVLFTILLDRAGPNTGVNTGGVPKALFLYVSLVAWTFYASSVSSGGVSLVGNPLLNKVYAPREVFPLSQVASSAINAFAAALVLPVLFVFTQRGPSITVYWVPLLLLIYTLFTIAITLVVCAVTVYLRDLRSGLPLILQLGMFMPGVLYPATAIKELHGTAYNIYSAVFPIAPLNEGLRTVFFHSSAPAATPTLCAAAGTAIYLLGAFMFFKRLETGFADVG